MTADTSARLAVLRPNPSAFSQGHTVGIQGLQLDWGVRGYLNVEGTVRLYIDFTEDTSLGERGDCCCGLEGIRGQRGRDSLYNSEPLDSSLG